MKPADRIVRIVHVEGVGLLASDTHGRVHLLDGRLRVVRSSPFVPQGRPLYGLAVADGWVIGKDRMGALFRWSLDTLELVDRLDPAAVCDPALLIPDERPSPVSSRGISIWKGKVHVTSGYHRQMLVVDLHTFTVLEIRPNICGTSPMEWACTEHPTRHAVSDKKGNLRFGSFDGDADFPDRVKLDDGNIHRVRYDARHDRFWATQDFGAGENADIANGVVVVNASGEKEDECLFARDDVEFVTFSPDHLRAYAGGFDGELHIFDNTERALRITRTVTGFSHQLSDLAVSADDGQVYVLCQDGEIVQLDADGTFVRAMGFPRQAVWDIQPSPEDPATLYCATDTGVTVVRIRETAGGPMTEVTAEHPTGFGFTRRVAPVRSAGRSGWLGVTRDHRVFRTDHTGHSDHTDHTDHDGQDGRGGGRGGGDGGTGAAALRWSAELPALPHTVAVSPDGARALVATNAGAVEVDTADGHLLDTFTVDGLPVWAAAYLPDGDRLLVTRNGVIVVLDRADASVRWRFDQGEYPKRLWIQSGRAYLTGDGGVKELVVGEGVVARWLKLLSNTVENAVVGDGLVIASSYGMQLAAYDYTTGAFLGLFEDLPDYPKALHLLHGADGAPYLLVGCRTGLLSLYRIERRPKRIRLVKVRDHWLPRRPAVLDLRIQDR
ncbi:WD40 repeat domain-containing protein [Streptomyces sp. NPDC059134]|uniref:WD40 repeat domain-containing protein n=1 Tax=Streptomyces sp. NPDC059134 TaxID=3346738 RepID=UPI0036B10E75